MVATVLVGGIAAGLIADGRLAVAAAPFALLLVGGGMISLRRPVLAADRQLTGLSQTARSAIADTFAVLPAGAARSLLADVVRRGQAVQRALTLRQDSSGASAIIDDLVAVASVSARDLAALDDSLARFDRETARDSMKSTWIESLAECEQARDRAVQRLLDAVTVLGQLDTQSARGTEDATARLGELVAELTGEVRIRTAAREEVETLLAR